jgi:molybdopterin-biosynthesis enzyme MoeA-like protein
VPSEFAAIVEQVVEPDLLAGRGDPPTVVELEHGFPESALNLTFAEVIDRYPEVKLGSYPGPRMTVRLAGPDGAVTEAAETVRAAIDRLEASPAGERLAAAWAARTRHVEERP